MDHKPAIRGRHFGLLCALGAYGAWGLVLPVFLKLLSGAPAVQILAHRIVWSVLLLAVVIAVMRRWGVIRSVLATPRTLGMLLLSSLLIAVNWLVYIWAVLHGMMIQGSLGYFINPLMNVVLGVLILRERLRPAQVAAVGLAATGVCLLAWHDASGIWIALSLAVTFSCYGLVRKVAPVDALSGLFVETGMLAPAAVGWLVYEGMRGAGAFAAGEARLDWLLVSAVWLYGEQVSPFQWGTFGLIWVGCAVYAADSLRAGREPRVMVPECGEA